jgi:predicted nucleotidyltransferase
VIAPILLDTDAIARACERYHVARLRLFGSALTDRSDPERSDVDFLVDYKPDAERTFPAFFGLRDELGRIVGRPVDLIDAANIGTTLRLQRGSPRFKRSSPRGT